LIGFLEPLETRGFLFAKDEIKSTIINIPSPLGNEKKVSIEIVRSKGRIFSKVANGKPILGIEVKAEGNIGEQQENEDLTSDDNIEVLEKLVQGEISREIEGTLKVTQKIFKSDIFGFIDELYKNYYSEWTNVVSNWCDVYSDTPVNVEVQFNIRRPGLIKKPTEQK
jgi:spore germination protein KC